MIKIRNIIIMSLMMVLALTMNVGAIGNIKYVGNSINSISALAFTDISNITPNKTWMNSFVEGKIINSTIFEKRSGFFKKLWDGVTSIPKRIKKGIGGALNTGKDVVTSAFKGIFGIIKVIVIVILILILLPIILLLLGRRKNKTDVNVINQMPNNPVQWK